MIAYIENPKEMYKKATRINDFSYVTRYKIDMQEYFYILATIWKIILNTTCKHNPKHKDLSENCKTL